MFVAKIKRDDILAATCILVLVGILTAGLWPFHAPRNRVFWRKDGLFIDHRGTALSARGFMPSTQPDDTGRTIEAWFQPTRTDQSGTILAFYSPREPQQFSLYQSHAGLALRTELASAVEPFQASRLAFLPCIFQGRPELFITIASGRRGTAVYVDGSMVQLFPYFRPGGRAFIGRLVIGTSPVEDDSWSGVWRGLAIYDRELTAAAILDHYESWTVKGRPDIRPDERSSAVYLFNEHSGNILHNAIHSSSGIDLMIPGRYMLLDEKFLEPVWKEFRWRWSYGKSALINVCGFIPLGFFFACLFARRTESPALPTIVLGATVSLTIEVLQSFLPTRDSGTTDLITNTLGTGLGVMLYCWKPLWIAKTLDRLAFLLGAK